MHSVFRSTPLVLTSLSLFLAYPGCSKKPSFEDDLAFLKSHTEIHVLADEASGAQVAIAPAWQGRVMTSTDGTENAQGMGWINRKAITSGIKPESDRTGVEKHIHLFGGEERFWLGPEGGQFALFFPPAPAPYEFEHWKTPAVLDTEAFTVVSSTPRRIAFSKETELTNRAGTLLKMGIERTVTLLTPSDLVPILRTHVPKGVACVAYRSSNSITNRSAEHWTPEKGLVSIWLLGMFKHGSEVVSVVPIKNGPGDAVRTDYFGEVSKDRLLTTDNAVFFKTDGAYRSKIGVPPARSTGIAGAYDPERGLLTIIRTELPRSAASLPYVRSQWQDHANPYAGDLINIYNDGPTAPGEPPLGPFYELESSSPALPLAPGETLVHTQETMHFRGIPEKLAPIAKNLLGVSLEELSGVFNATR